MRDDALERRAMSEWASELELMQALLRHQLNPVLHPFTCGINSRHRPLCPAWSALSQKVILRCADCWYIQTSIPDFVRSAPEPAGTCVFCGLDATFGGWAEIRLYLGPGQKLGELELPRVCSWHWARLREAYARPDSLVECRVTRCEVRDA